MKTAVLLTIIFISFTELINAGEVKMRAREHYEIHTIKQNNVETKYKGLTNTINLWWEKPFDLSLGLSFSPILSNFKKDKGILPDKEIDLYHFGIEAKIFEQDLFGNFYIRPGLSYTILKIKSSTQNFTGLSTYLGLGYELAFNKFSVALEAAYRFSSLEKDYTIDTITPSIGFHFYKQL